MSDRDPIYELAEQLINAAFPGNEPAELKCSIFRGENVYFIHSTRNNCGGVTTSIVDNLG